MAKTTDLVQEEPQLIAFGDLAASECLDSLGGLLHAKGNASLADFFARVGFGLRQHLGRLPSTQQALFPSFSTLIDLLARWEDAPGRPALQLFLLSVLQSAWFIHHYGGNEAVEYPSAANTCIISSCAGNFAAAAASCAQSIPSFVPLAVESALAAFRTGLKSLLVGEAIVAERSDAAATWSASVLPTTHVTVEELLGTFTESANMLDNHETIWIAARTPSGVTTLGGRPLVLADFAAVNKDKLRVKWLNIASPYHAPHLFGVGDVDEIMDQVVQDAATSTAARIASLPACSSDDSRTNFLGRLRTAVDGALRQQLDLTAMFKSCGEHVSQTGSRRCHLTTIAYGTTSMLSASLLNNFGIHLDIQDASQVKASVTFSPGRFGQSKIAIVGYSGRFPSADSNEAFWELLRAGRDVHRKIPEDRFNCETHFDEEGRATNKSRVKHGCFVDSPGLFDARFFNMSPREAENTDPAQRLAILTTYEAMEMAGFVRNRTPSTQDDRVGVFLGSTSDDWREINSSQNVDTYFIPGANRAFGPRRISYFFRLSGPSVSIDTACSSSFAALQMACSYLWSGQCDTAIAGGSNIMTNPNLFCGLDRAHFLSTTGNCNAFDDGADGYCRADAVASVMLKRLEDAEADHDPVFGVIVAANTNHCARAESITRPHEGDQTALFQHLLRQANYDALDVSVVEMHGTGTQVGDATEMGSVLSTFVPGRERSEAQLDRPLYVGSVKANTGHSEAASGVAALIKVLLMLKHNEIPPHCGIKTRINRSYPLDLAERGVHIATRPTPWPRYPNATKRAAFVNNFSAAGGNTAVLVEEAPPRAGHVEEVVDRETHLVAVSAKTATSLVRNAQSLASWLQDHPDTALPALSYTTTARRMHHEHRIMVSAENVPMLIEDLTLLSSQDPKTRKAVSCGKRPRVIFTFTGQGSLYAGMGRHLYRAHGSFRKDVAQLNQLAESYGFPSFIGFIDGSIGAHADGIHVVASHLALVCTQLALVRLLGRWRIKPSAVIGHSLGEYAALYAARVISAGDAIYLVGKRASLLDRHCRKGTHGMLVVKASRQATEHLLQAAHANFEVACANHPTAHVVAGPKDEMPAVITEAHKTGLATVELHVPFAFHSSQVQPILSEFEAAAAQAGLVFSAPQIPFISPLLGRVVPQGEGNTLNVSYLAQASRRLVDFSTALTMAQVHGLSGSGVVWLEVGAHPLCASMIKQTLGAGEPVLNTLREDARGCTTMAKSVEALYLAGMDIDWNEYHREFPAAHRVLELPRYAWDLKNYWIDYRDDFCVNRCARLETAQGTERMAEAKTYKYISPVAQRVLEEVHRQTESLMVVESDVFHRDLLPVLHGHAINGAHLCPSSLYAEVALTMGDYLVQERKLCRQSTGLEVFDLHIDQPLIAKEDETTHVFRTTVSADWTANVLSLAIASVAVSGEQQVSHATVKVRVVPDQHWLADWKRNAHLVVSRVQALERSDHGQKLRRRMVYKLFAGLVDYSDAFQGMSEVLLDTDELEAVSTVQFQVDAQNGKYGIDARWIDSLGHISGFIMNANDSMDNQEQVFINHGWEKLRHAEKLSASTTYRAYCKMQRAEKTTFVGDVFVLDGHRIVAMYEGIKFIGMQRRILNRLLPARGMARGEKPVAAEAVQHNARLGHFSNNAKADLSCASTLDIATKSSATASRSGSVMDIICQEIGISPCHLDPEAQLADLGVDSLLALSISSRIRQELGISISSAELLECRLVGQLQHLTGSEGSFVSSSSTDFDNCSHDSEGTSLEGSLASATSELCSSDTSDGNWIRRVLWEAMAHETATPVDDLLPSTPAADLGIDSLLAIAVAASLCDKLGVSITGTAVLGCETLLDLEVTLREMLCGLPGPGSARVIKTSSPSVPNPKDKALTSAPESVPAETARSSVISHDSAAASVLLSGSVSTARSVLILFPDGSGSAASYASLAPTFHKAVAVYGVNCPWRKNGLELARKKMTVSEIVAKQLVEIHRILDTHTRHGWRNATKGAPNLVFGGWSAGGIFAYEAIRQIAGEGVPVSKLLLLDSPDPFGLQIPSRKMSCFLKDVLRFGGRTAKAPDWLLLHFDAMVEVLGRYKPLPLPSNTELDTLLIYASKGAYNDYADPENELQAVVNRDISWILRDRTDFSGAGWTRLVGSEGIGIEILDSADHFTMMEDEQQLRGLGDVINGFLG